MRRQNLVLFLLAGLIVTASLLAACGSGGPVRISAPGSTSSSQAGDSPGASVSATTQAPSPTQPTSPTSAASPTTTTQQVSADVALAQAIERLQAALGLPDGAVTKSSKPPLLPGSGAVLQWKGGTAELAVDTGLIRVIRQDWPAAAKSAPLVANAELDAAATRIATLLGWDDASLAAAHFTPGESKLLPRSETLTEYCKTWVGHDDQGLPNTGLIDVGLDAGTKQLLSFAYFPGPTGSATNAPGTLTQVDAVRIAKGVIGSNSQRPTTTAPPGQSTMSTVPLGVVVESAVLTHTSAPGITGGKDLLVWIVKLGGSTSTGLISATVYVDAKTGAVLTWSSAA